MMMMMMILIIEFTCPPTIHFKFIAKCDKCSYKVRQLINLACVSSETHNLQRVFHPRGGGGVVPYIGYMGMCCAKGYGFSAVLV